jgi:hypothetical protein
VLRAHTGRILCFHPDETGDTLVLYGRDGEQGELLLQAAGDWSLDAEHPHAIVSAEAEGDTLSVRYWLTAGRPRLRAHANGRPFTLQLLREEDVAAFPAPGSKPLAELQLVSPATRTLRLETQRLAVTQAEADAGWAFIDAPDALERLGCDLGYGWYRAELELDAPLETTLLAPALADRATVLLNGEQVATLGVDPAGSRFSMPLTLPAGRHELRFLLDNLGRFNYGSGLGELKGLVDTLYLGGEQTDLTRGWVALWQEAVFAGEALAQAHPAALRPDAADVDLSNFAFEGQSVWLLRTFQAEANRSYVLYLTGDRNPGALFVNGQAVERFSRHKSGGLIKHAITAQVQPGENQLALNIQGYAGVGWRALLLSYDPSKPLPARWSFRPGHAAGAPTGLAASAPCEYRATFPRLAAAALRLRLQGARKGQLWLNGRNLGRFWQIGPQEQYKLPASWQEDENELLVFAEDGREVVVAIDY